MSVPTLVKSCHQISNDSFPPQLSFCRRTCSECQLPTDHVHVWREDGSRESRPVRKPGRPVAALHINEPPLRQSQGDVIRGTVRGEERRSCVAPKLRQAVPTSPEPFTFLAPQLNLGENRQEQGEELQVFNCLKCFHCSKLSCHG